MGNQVQIPYSKMIITKMNNNEPQRALWAFQCLGTGRKISDFRISSRVLSSMVSGPTL